MKYKAGDIVWLVEFDNGEEVQPRQQALFEAYEKDETMAIVSVVPDERGDDGLRELTVDQIEGLVDEKERMDIKLTNEARRYITILRRNDRDE